MARILVADDQADIRRLVEVTLRNRGHEVTAVASGDEALRAAERETPDLAILDVNMPELEGTQVARLLRARPETASMPIILLTALSGESDTLAGFASGADDYVTKPFNPRELSARVTALLARAGSSSAPEPRPQGRLIVVAGPKGGVGRTTLAVNLALAAHQARPGQRTILFDANLWLGEADVHLGLRPGRTILDLVPYAGRLDVAAVEDVLADHRSGLKVMLRPRATEEAERVTATLLREVMQIAAAIADVVVVDTEARYDDERGLACLEVASTVLLVVSPEIGSVRNTRYLLDLAARLGLDTARMRPVLNRASSRAPLTAKDVAAALGVAVESLAQIPDAGPAVASQASLGEPMILADPRSEFSRATTRLAASLVTAQPVVAPSGR